jgi:hypothetical protein
MPSMIASDRNAHATTVQRRVALIHAASSRPDSSAPIANANGTVMPT